MKTPNKNQAKQINALKSQLGQLLKRQAANPNAGKGGGDQPQGLGRIKKKFKFACWHCKSKEHPVALCPVAKAGKPPLKDSYFWKQRNGVKDE